MRGYFKEKQQRKRRSTQLDRVLEIYEFSFTAAVAHVPYLDTKAAKLTGGGGRNSVDSFGNAGGHEPLRREDTGGRTILGVVVIERVVCR